MTRARRRRRRARRAREGRLRPVERIAVAEERHGAVLDQVAGEQDGRVRDLDDDVVVGMPAAEDGAARPRRSPTSMVARLGERPVGRIDDDLGEVGGELRHPRRRSAARATSPVRSMNVPQPIVAPDRRRPEDVVAEGVVEMAVGVDDDRDRRRGQLAQVVEDLARLDVGRAGVDHQDLVAARARPRCSGRRTRSAGRRPDRRSPARRSWTHGSGASSSPRVDACDTDLGAGPPFGRRLHHLPGRPAPERQARTRAVHGLRPGPDPARRQRSPAGRHRPGRVHTGRGRSSSSRCSG